AVGQAHAALHALERHQAALQPDARAHLHRRGEAHLVRAVVDAAAALAHLHDLAAHAGHERERQHAVGDGLAVGQLAPRARHVHMEPVAVARDAGEVGGHFLGEFHPVGPAQELAHMGFQVVGGVESQHRLALQKRASPGRHAPGYRTDARRPATSACAWSIMRRTSSPQVGTSSIRPWIMPTVQMPPSTSPLSYTPRPLAPATSGPMRSMPAPAASSSTTWPDRALRQTRLVLRRLRRMSRVSVSLERVMASLMAGCTGDSWVHMKRVPMLMPSAPSASAATRPRASPKPPEAITGMSTCATVAGIRIRPGMSFSPTWPAHSKPSMETMSTPISWALRAWRGVVHLWITRTPAAFRAGRCSRGLLPAVSTILMPASMMASRYSA